LALPVPLYLVEPGIRDLGCYLRERKETKEAVELREERMELLGPLGLTRPPHTDRSNRVAANLSHELGLLCVNFYVALNSYRLTLDGTGVERLIGSN
jgi:hypothetical protein